MPAATKFWAGHLLFELLPAAECPVEDPELFNIITQIRHVFGGESLIYGMKGEGEQYATGSGAQEIRQVTHGRERIFLQSLRNGY